MCHFLSLRIGKKGMVIRMEQNMEYRQQLIQEYKEAVIPLLKYLPWLEKNAGKAGSSIYEGDGVGENSISFPVYDSVLLGFVKDAAKSPLMEKNYSYVYTRKRIQSHVDERRLIKAAQLQDWDVLRGILSKYVLGGRTKAVLWSEAASEGIFALVLDQMRMIIEYWDKPIDMNNPESALNRE